MSVVAAKELEDDAKKYASEAIRLDSQGAHGMAIQMYQKAISTLVKLVHIYPDYRLNRQYTERAMAYQERVKAIQAAHGLLPQDQGPRQRWRERRGNDEQSELRQGTAGRPAAKGFFQRARHHRKARRKVGRRHRP